MTLGTTRWGSSSGPVANQLQINTGSEAYNITYIPWYADESMTKEAIQCGICAKETPICDFSTGQCTCEGICSCVLFGFIVSVVIDFIP